MDINFQSYCLDNNRQDLCQLVNDTKAFCDTVVDFN